MFDSVIGHDRAREQLATAVRSNRSSHAYLLTGPTAVGKATLARAFARALLCQRELDQKPCGTCQSCRLFDASAHPDFRAIDRASGEERRGRLPKFIPIEAVRELQHDAALSAHLGGFKLYLIDGADDLSLPAMDALLKTLEEPPPRVVLLLTCVDVGIVPATVISRCQVVKLGVVAVDAIAALLRARHGLDPDRAELLAHLSLGRPGPALALAAEPAAADQRAAALAEVRALEASSRAERLKEVERIAGEHSRNADATARRLALLASWWRDLLFVRAGCEELVVNRDQLAALRPRAAALTIGQIGVALRAVDQTELYLSENVQPRLALESLALTLP